jgi:hypothetical protein
MEANELRMGNWLKRLDNTLFQVTGNDIHSMDDLPDYLKPHPIPLTEEWLLKLGILKNGHNCFTSGGWCELYFVNGVLNFEYDDKTIAIAENVHQLQNLYFALTGEELTIKTENK